MLPDNWSCAHPEWKNKPGYLHYDTPYLLICDNLLDFSHLSYVHEKTLGGSTEIALARPTVEKIDADGQGAFASVDLSPTCQRRLSTSGLDNSRPT